MSSRVALVAALVVFAVSSAWAADVTGKWTAKVPGPQGESEITLNLKMDGTTVSGTLNNTQAPGDVEIKDGKSSGDEISFSLTRRIGNADMKVVWKGMVSGDEIKFTRTTEGGAGGAPTEIIARRAK
jgi:hypothetical protein